MILSKENYLSDKLDLPMDNIHKGQWLITLLDELNWSPADLSRATGLDSAVISNIRNGKRGLGLETAKKIGKATHRRPEEILSLAGEFSPEPIETKLARQITHITAQLPPEEQQGLLEFAKLRLRLSEKQGQYETRKPAKHTGSTK